MNIKTGAPPEGKAPAVQVRADQSSTCLNCSAFGGTCKPLDPTIFSRYDRQGYRLQLQAYLDLGLTPIPLRGKIPIVKWKRGNWHPKTLDDLKHYLNRPNWGLRTGGNFAVVDFDTKESFTSFVTANIDKLPIDVPIVKTARGFHIWFRPTQPLRDMHFEGIDIKAEGGQVVVPPSIHPKTGQRYKFIKPPKEDIPVLDLDELEFPSLKKREPSTGRLVEGRKPAKGIRTDKPRFNYEKIANGVDDGGRTLAAVSFIGHLIWEGLPKEEIRAVVLEWNARNRPPIEHERINWIIDDVYNRYAIKNQQNGRNNNNAGYDSSSGEDFNNNLDTAANTPVPTKTHSNFNSVLVETRPYQRPSRIQPLYTPDSPTPANQYEQEYSWETEHEPRYTVADCGKRRAIMRRGREYMSVSFFCGKWSCPRCGPFFKNRWIEQMLETTKDTGLYVTEIREHDWGCFRKQINRLKADYMKIRSAGGMFKIITDRPLDGSTELPQGSLRTYLEASIPQTASRCPISTSGAWQHHKNDKSSSEYEAVTTTWLPVKDQVEVAEELGARKLKRTRWLAPGDVDELVWAEKFKEAINERESLVSWWLKHPMYGMDMREYLDREYMEDALNDELEKDRDSFDDTLAAVC